MKKHMKKPAFVEPNLDVVQVAAPKGWFGNTDGWLDYASIKTPADMKDAIALVDGNPQEYRIVRKHMGTTVIYPASEVK